MKKLFATLLSLLFSFALLAGCSPADSAAPSPYASPTASALQDSGAAQPSDSTIVDSGSSPASSGVATQPVGNIAAAPATNAPAPQATAQPAAAQPASKAPAAQATAKPATQKPAATAAPQNNNTIACTISVDCKTAVNKGYVVASQVSSGGTMLSSTSVTLEKGDSVYDALKKVESRCGRIIKQGSGSRIYVQAINSLGERDCGSGSGWMYSVNGSYPNQSCSAYILKNGDRIQWRYTLDQGVDLGAKRS